MEFFPNPLYDSFYDNLILSGTKIPARMSASTFEFYDNLILSGTKMFFMLLFAINQVLR